MCSLPNEVTSENAPRLAARVSTPSSPLCNTHLISPFSLLCQDYNEKDQKTWQGLGDLRSVPMKAVYDKFGLDEGTTDFIGHSLALNRDDGYMQRPAYDTVMAIKLYAESLARFGGNSPYIYPLYGLGELPQAFARLSAVYGGTYMLSKADATVVYDEAGVAVGVSSEGATARAKMIVGDPSYFPGKTRKTKEVVRAMCIMSHPIPSTDDAHSAQIIIPYKQSGAGARAGEMIALPASRKWSPRRGHLCRAMSVRSHL